MDVYVIVDAEDDTPINDKINTDGVPWVVAPTPEAAREAWLDYSCRKLRPDVPLDLSPKLIVPVTLDHEVIIAGQEHLEAIAKLFQPQKSRGSGTKKR